MYDDSVNLIEQLQALHPAYRLEVLEEVFNYFYEDSKEDEI